MVRVTTRCEREESVWMRVGQWALSFRTLLMICITSEALHTGLWKHMKNIFHALCYNEYLLHGQKTSCNITIWQITLQFPIYISSSYRATSAFSWSCVSSHLKKVSTFKIPSLSAQLSKFWEKYMALYLVKCSINFVCLGVGQVAWQEIYLRFFHSACWGCKVGFSRVELVGHKTPKQLTKKGYKGP